MSNQVMLSRLLDLLADAIAERIVARVGTATKTVYTTSKRGPHCPGKSRDWMLRHIKNMAGARKVGRDWEIDATDFAQWARARDTDRCRRPAPPIAGDIETLADAYLEAAGYRVTRRDMQ